MTNQEAIEILERLIPILQRADGHSTTHLLIKIALNKAIEALEQEPKTGRWIYNQNGTFTCDNCGCKHSKSNFCPNCGADMSGKEKEC